LYARLIWRQRLAIDKDIAGMTPRPSPAIVDL
jgi:hypothetical protein